MWLALASVGHVHHATALSWLEKSEGDEVIFCRVTQKGLLRLLTNAPVMGGNVLTSSQAWDLYDRLRTETKALFAPEPPGMEREWRDATRYAHTGPNFWTDAYLAAFAVAAGYTVATFDQGFKRHKAAKLHLLA